MSSSPLVIARRFNGPPHSGNGGYSCGVLGTLVGDSAEVTLRTPPPLDTPLSVSERDGVFTLLHDTTIVAEGRRADPEIEVPAPPDVETARAAERGYIGHSEHLCPTCFVCGPARAEGDGLRIFTGPVSGREIVAALWTPGEVDRGDDGFVDRRIVWSALDCPSYFGGRLRGYGAVALLGRLTAKLLGPLRVNEAHLVIGWPLSQHGRKWEGGSALYTRDGELLAYARGVWVELRSSGA